MLFQRHIINAIATLLFSAVVVAQHPNRKNIDSLKEVLQSAQGTTRVDCLNALSEEYWWPPRVFPDSISCWASPAFNEAVALHYAPGKAMSVMHLGVSEIYRKNFLTAENYLRQSLQMMEVLKSKKGIAWAHLWLGQALYSENKFKEAIANYRTAIQYLGDLNDLEGLGKAWAWMGFIYAATGNYDSSFEYCSKSLYIRQKMSDDVCVTAALTNMGHLYRVAGAYDDALNYYRQGMNYANEHSVSTYDTHWNYLDEPLGIIYRILQKPDSSLHYLENALKIDPENQMTQVSVSENLLGAQRFDAALPAFIKPIEQYRKENNRWDLMRILIDAAKAYYGKKDYKNSLRYASEGVGIAERASVNQYMQDGYLLLSRIYQELRQPDSAYEYLQKYTRLKDSVMSNQFLWRLSNYKKQEEVKKQLDQIALLGEANKIKEEKLKQESLMKWILLGCLLLVAFSGFIIYKNLALRSKNEKLESRRKQAVLQQHVTELEMQALRAQMNPHFLFNCLSSINSFILKNETELASDYLTKFSRLVRMVLANSKKSFIALEDELNMLRLYLDMERLRFKNSFDYSITCTNSLDDSIIYVPPLILQPFVENAIWHGLMHKEGQGLVEIKLDLEDKFLNCVITDNGVGRTKAAIYKSKSAALQKSMGLQITSERLDLLDEVGKGPHFTIEDLENDDGKAGGTKVLLRIRYKTLTEIEPENS
ncbi:MAG: tetratricopeptide repeat-containing sensor histidine kinase [Flavisolibacter sp.]